MYLLQTRLCLHLYSHTVSWGCFVCLFVLFSSMSVWFTLLYMARAQKALHVPKWKTLTFGFNKASTFLKMGSSYELSRSVCWKGWKGQFSVLLPMCWTIPSSLWLEDNFPEKKTVNLQEGLGYLCKTMWFFFIHSYFLLCLFQKEQEWNFKIIMFLNDLACEKMFENNA